MNRKMLIYWLSTAVLALVFIGGGLTNLLDADAQVQIMTDLGYPLYLMTLLGVAKLAGISVVLLPGLPRLKEWAYAGISIDLVGAAYSHFGAGDPIASTFAPLVIFLVGLISYFLRPASRRGPGF